jgi:SsrA-binding protein
LEPQQINIRNKRARFEYFLLDEFTAGMVLSGTEIKSIRLSKASILEAYCVFQNGEVWIRNMFINEYANGSFYNHKPRHDRKLLLNKKEISKIEKFMKVKGNTLVPIKMFINEKGWAKLLFAMGQGKKMNDKRDDLKEKDDRREMDRAMKVRNK